MKTGRLRMTWKTWALSAVMVTLLAAWGVFHSRIQASLTAWLLLRSSNPSEEFFADSVKKATEPVELLERCWATGKVSHRQLVAAFLKDSVAAHLPWLDRAEPLLLACTSDADASVRELGLAALAAEHSPRLLDAAQAQLADLDPQVRMLGLNYVRKSEPKRAVPILIRSLDDSDLRIVATAEAGLMRLSGEDYGVRASQALPPPTHPGQIDPANLETIRRGVEKRKAWWQDHQPEYGVMSDPAAASREARALCATRPAAPGFNLPDLRGKMVSLSQFRGKVVFLNFWATWCTACLAELPDLEALQQKMGNQIVILGVSLDGVPDEDGDIPTEDADGGSHQARPSVNALRAKVERAVKARRINYPVLLDPKNSVGGQYNGGELPTTVILDADGRVRRRFIGERSLPVFEAMVAEASRPLPAARQFNGELKTESPLVKNAN